MFWFSMLYGSALTFTNGFAAELCPLPMALTCGLLAANDVFVTGAQFPGTGDGAAELIGVTEGFHVAPPLYCCCVFDVDK